MRMNEVMDDLSARFLINLPKEEENRKERLFFQIEEAHWFYEDYYRKKFKLPKLNLRVFAFKIAMHSGIFLRPEEIEDEFKSFLKYKKTVPVFGALIFNGTMDKILLVKGFGPHMPYTFPRGKVCRSETDVECAIREVFEEVGYDARSKIVKNICLDMGLSLRESKLFVVINVPETTKFVTHTRNEIQDIRWVEIEEIRKGNAPLLSYVKTHIGKIKEIARKIQEQKESLDRKKIKKAFGL